MARRPFRCYRIIKNKPYPKSKYCRKCPNSKIKIFDMGKKQFKDEIFPCCINLVNLEPINISSECLEAIRICINRNLTKTIKKKYYHFKIKMHPLHIIRNNKMLSKAGADRVQTGMRNSFGKPEGLVSAMHKNSAILSIRCKYNDRNKVVQAIKSSIYKISGKQKIVESKNWGFKNTDIIEYILKKKYNITPNELNKIKIINY